jgi:hypothetical protein
MSGPSLLVCNRHGTRHHVTPENYAAFKDAQGLVLIDECGDLRTGHGHSGARGRTIRAAELIEEKGPQTPIADAGVGVPPPSPSPVALPPDRKARRTKGGRR